MRPYFRTDGGSSRAYEVVPPVPIKRLVFILLPYRCTRFPGRSSPRSRPSPVCRAQDQKGTVLFVFVLCSRENFPEALRRRGELDRGEYRFLGRDPSDEFLTRRLESRILARSPAYVNCELGVVFCGCWVESTKSMTVCPGGKMLYFSLSSRSLNAARDLNCWTFASRV
jgi:hypothetical protein